MAKAAKPLTMRFESKDSVSLSTLTRTTPVPNQILDEVMPRIGDTELRVLMVVVRSTLGWQEGARRKESDWLSHRQLQARTGRSSAVVSRAVDGLVKRGLIRITNEVGQELWGSQERSRSRGRLFYRLISDAESVDIQDELQSAEDSLGSASKTKALSAPDTIESSLTALEISATASETLPRKVRTTKETGTKEILTKETQTKENKESDRKEGASFIPSLTSKSEALPAHFLPVDLNHQKAHCRSPALQESEVQQGSNEAATIDDDDSGEDSEVVGFICTFEGFYRKVRPSEAVPETSLEDLALLKRYVERYGRETLQGWLPTFFKSTFGYVRRRSWSMRSFLDCYFVLQTGRRIN
jgi:hypothetical protein